MHTRKEKLELDNLEFSEVNFNFIIYEEKDNEYIRMLHISILEKYNNRIFNIHPALLPKFGGKGMYGMNVHIAVIEAKETGVTISTQRT